MSFRLSSPAFPAGGPLPRKYTAEGDDCSPPLEWVDAPAGTRSFALAMVDPDAPSGTFHHWTLVNIPPDASGLPECFPGSMPLEDMAEAENGFGHMGYGGPLPPHGDGPHRYVFTLYALGSDRLDIGPSETAEALIRRIEPLAVARAELIGLYER